MSEDTEKEIEGGLRTFYRMRDERDRAFAERDDMRKEGERVSADLTLAAQRIQELERQLAQVSSQRDWHMKRALELKTRIAAIMEACTAAVEAARPEEAMYTPPLRRPEPPEVEEGIRQIAQRLAPRGGNGTQKGEVPRAS